MPSRGPAPSASLPGLPRLPLSVPACRPGRPPPRIVIGHIHVLWAHEASTHSAMRMAGGCADPVRDTSGGTLQLTAPDGSKLGRLLRRRQELVRESESSTKSSKKWGWCGKRIKWRCGKYGEAEADPKAPGGAAA